MTPSIPALLVLPASPASPATSDYLAEYVAKVPSFEGSVNWLYRDSSKAGNPTTGVGLLLPSLAASQALPWQAGPHAASTSQIEADWVRVMLIRPGLVARAYYAPDALTLTEQEITSQLTRMVEKIDAQLAAAVEVYNSAPASAKLALLDLAYNLGLHGLLEGFPRLMQAVGQRDWQQVAGECLRPQLGVLRNSWTRQQFVLAAARSESRAALGSGRTV